MNKTEIIIMWVFILVMTAISIIILAISSRKENRRRAKNKAKNTYVRTLIDHKETREGVKNETNRRNK